LLTRTGRVDQAIEVLRDAWRRGDAGATQALADLLTRTGRIDEADDVLKDGSAPDPQE
jgi:Flp pilus assembly protein TadD